MGGHHGMLEVFVDFYQRYNFCLIIFHITITINVFGQSFFVHPTWDQKIIDYNTGRMKDMHRDWRSKLSHYVDGKKKGQDPSIKWPFIKKDHWEQFVCERTTEEALVSTKNV